MPTPGVAGLRHARERLNINCKARAPNGGEETAVGENGCPTPGKAVVRQEWSAADSREHAQRDVISGPRPARAAYGESAAGARHALAAVEV